MAPPRLGRLSSSAALAVLAGVAAFAARFLLQGAIENDHFLQLARAHQVVHGNWPIRDFVDPGQMLTYMTSAAAAGLFGPSLLTEAVWLILLLSAAAAVTFLLAHRASGSALVAWALVAIEIAVRPRLYNAGKLFFPAVAILLAWRYADSPSRTRLAALAAWTTISFLWRHDYAVCIGIAAIALLTAIHCSSATRLAGRLGLYLGLSLVFLLPWLAYVQWAQGLPAYVSSALGYVESEAQRTVMGWPGRGASGDSAAAIAVFYVILALPCVALWLGRRNDGRITLGQTAFAAVLAFAVYAAFLRDALTARLPDVLVPPLVLAAAVVGRFQVRIPQWAVAMALVVLTVAGGALVAARGYTLTPATLVHRAGEVASRLRTATPAIAPSPELLPLVTYLAECTPSTERVLVSGFEPQIPVLARRPFAAGHPILQQNYYTSDDDQQRAASQLSRETVSMAILFDGSDAFRSEWPPIAAGLTSREFVERTWQLGQREVTIWLPPARAHVTPANVATCGAAN